MKPIVKGAIFKLICTCIMTVVFSVNLMAQDIHFSQYYASPLNLSPALTGSFKGDYRFIGNFRNQWQSITTPYKTFGFSADTRNIFGYDGFHGGLSVISDEAGDGEFGTILVNISAAFSYPLNYDSSHSVTFGVQPGFAQRKINFNEFTFDNQYSIQQGRFDPDKSTAENFATNNISYLNLGAGLCWDWRINKTNKITSGFSVFNLLNPKQSYFKNEDVKLNRRLTVHANAQIRVHPQIDVLPGISTMRQGKYNEFIFGSSGRYLINGLTSLHLGYWYRNQDAGFITGGITHQTLYLGVSYDMNTSRLKEASNGRGGVEFSLIYTFKRFNGKIVKYKACPSYI